MKSISRVVAALASITLAGTVFGCEKSNDLTELQSEAAAVVKYYQPKLDELDHRIKTLISHSQVPPTASGTADANLMLKNAEEKLHEAGASVALVTREAESLAKAGDVYGLQKLIDESRDKLDQSTTLIDDRVESVESWLGLAQSTPPPPATVPPITAP